MTSHAFAQLLELPARRAAPLDVGLGKLRVPSPRPGSIRRTALVNRLRAARRVPVVSIVAPAGYGKTTTLAQWLERDDRAAAWISLDRRDDDPVRLLLHLAGALDRITPLPNELIDALRAPRVSIWKRVVPRLAETLDSLPQPSIVVLDNFEHVRSHEALEVIAALTHQLPDESTLVLSGRTEPGVRLGTLRADGLLLEIGMDGLALNRREAESLFDAGGVHNTDEELALLLTRTEGWPAALHLAALARKDQPDEPAGAFSGADRNVDDYLQAEYLGRLSADRLSFLMRTSIVESMCGSLCDALLGRTGSAYELEALEREDLFLVPLDRSRTWFRYRHLFRDQLRHRLEQHEAGELRTLHRRAAAWYEAHGDLTAAVPHLVGAGQHDRAADLVERLVLPACDEGRAQEVEPLIALFHEDQLDRHPAVAAVGAWVHLLLGDAPRALQLAALAESSGEVQPLAAIVRSALCLEGPERMLADARRAADGLPALSRLLAIARTLEGVAQVLLGDLEAADACLRRAAEEATAAASTTALAAATAQRALIAAATGDEQGAASLAAESLALTPHDTARIGRGVLGRALWARELLRQGSWQEAISELAAADALLATSSPAVPWLAVQTSLAIARSRLALRDRSAAESALAAADAVLLRHPQLGTLPDEVAELRRRASSEALGNPAALTKAELRLLPLLATHLSFREIGNRLFVSRNTVKTQAISVYRKLGVSSRSEAIERATEIGLLAGVSQTQ